MDRPLRQGASLRDRAGGLTPRALFHGLGLSALIACAGCQRPQDKADQLLEVIVAQGNVIDGMAEFDSETVNGFRAIRERLEDIEARLPASGTETRQGGNEVPSRSDDGPTRNAGDAR